MSGRRVLAITLRLVQQFRRDHRTLALLFAVPLVILSLLALLMRGGGDHPAVGIVNLDRGPLGAAVTRQLEQSPNVAATTMDEGAAAVQLRDGKLAGYVVLPADLTESAIARGVVQPEIHLEGSEPGPTAAVVQAVNQSLLPAAESLLGATGARPPRFQPAVTFRYGGPSLDQLDYFGGAFVGIVVFFLVFVVTCVSFLRERAQGTLERLMASPLRRSEIVTGYMLGFTLLALLQSLEVLVFCLWVLRIHNSGSVLLIFGIETLMALAAVNLGIFLSMFARTEFQAVQFIPLVIVPQLLLGGIVFPLSTEPGWLQSLSNVLPLTYAVSALRDVMIKGADLSWNSVRLDVAVLLAFCTLVILAAAATLRRRIA